MIYNNSAGKRIVICLDGFRQGGTQQAILHLLPFFCAKFDKVFLIILQENSLDLIPSSHKNLEIKKLKSKKLLDLMTTLKLFYFFRQEKPDVILSSMFRSMVLTAISRNSASKLFWLEQNTYVNRKKWQWLSLQLLIKRVFKVICISNDVANFSRKYLSSPNKIVVIPNPIYISNTEVNFSKRDDDFIFIGRLVPQKNPELALQSFKSYQEFSKKDSKLHIVGDGELMQSLKQEARNLGISQDCNFYGFLPNAEVYDLLKRTKTLISTSVIEGLAMVRIEALANGNCIVTTNTGGTAQFFRLQANLGVFESEADPLVFARKMYDSLDGRYWNNKVIADRKSIALNFAPEEIASQFLHQFCS